MKKNKEKSFYIKQLKKQFPYIGKNEKIFISNFEKQILSDASNSYKYDDLVKKYGLPSEIASAYFEDNTNYSYHKYQKIKIGIYILCILSLVLILFSILNIIVDSDDSYINREIIEIQEE